MRRHFSPVSIVPLKVDCFWQVVEENMGHSCKCHGVSGSCRVQTCWRQLATFRKIGTHLKQRYDRAKLVKLEKKRQRHMLLMKNGRKPKPDDIVYTHDSPDYCRRNVEQGSLGTQGRRCNKTASGRGSCKLLCCGRGFNTNSDTQISRCGCKFYYCCYVKCKTCRERVSLHTCK